MREWENQKTNFDEAISTSYKNIEWTKVRVAALHDLYQAAPLSNSHFYIFILFVFFLGIFYCCFVYLGMQCNGSDGSRLPGLWDNTAATPVKLPLAPAARDCPDFSTHDNSLDQSM